MKKWLPIALGLIGTSFLIFHFSYQSGKEEAWKEIFSDQIESAKLSNEVLLSRLEASGEKVDPQLFMKMGDASAQVYALRNTLSRSPYSSSHLSRRWPFLPDLVNSLVGYQTPFYEYLRVTETETPIPESMKSALLEHLKKFSKEIGAISTTKVD
ncbi:MAG: hypothetical protein AB7H97_13950 [Pseudobdellovibrionaceae bacterium]